MLDVVNILYTTLHVQAMDLELDGTGFGLGKRSQRYAAVIENGVVSDHDS